MDLGNNDIIKRRAAVSGAAAHGGMHSRSELGVHALDAESLLESTDIQLLAGAGDAVEPLLHLGQLRDAETPADGSSLSNEAAQRRAAHGWLLISSWRTPEQL